MGKTIEGLTIRIGANVTDFKRDLKSANGALSSTQSLLRSVNKALKFDPASVSLLNARMKMVNSSAFSAAAKVKSLSESIAELKQETAVAQLAKDTDKLALHLKRCVQQYDEMDSELGAYHDQLKAIAKQNDVTFNKGDTLATARELRDLGVLADADVEHLEGLKEAWFSASNALDTAKKAQQLVKLTNELGVAEAETKEFAAQAVKASSAISMLTKNNDGFNNLVKQAGILDSALKSADDEAARLRSSLDIDPSNMNTVVRLANLSGDRFDLLGEKIKNVSSQITVLSKLHGIDANKDLKNAAANAELAADNLAKAKEETKGVSSELKIASDKLEQLRKNTSTTEDDLARAELDVTNLSKRFEVLADKEKEASEAYSKASAAAAINGLLSELSELEAKQKSVIVESMTMTNAMDKAYSTLRSSFSSLSGSVAPAFSMVDTAALSAASKVSVLTERIAELKKTTAVAQLAKDTDNLALHVGKCTQRYDEIDARLADCYNGLKRISAENKIAFDEDDPMSVANVLVKIGAITEDDVAHIQKLRIEWQKASDSLDVANGAQELAKLTAELRKAEDEAKEFTAQAVKAGSAISVLAKSNDGFKNLVKESNMIDDALLSTREEAERLKGALAINPKNMQAVRDLARNAREQFSLLESKVKNANNQIKVLSKLHGIDIAKDLKNASKNAENAAEKLRVISAEAKKADAELKLATDKMEQLKANTSSTENEIRDAEIEVERLTEKFEQLAKEERIASKAYSKASAVESIRSLKAEVTSLKAEQKALGNGGKAMSSSVGNGFAALRSTAAAFSTNVTPHVMMAAHSIITSAEEIDEAYRDMRKTVEGTEEQFEALKQSAMESSSQSVVSSDEILKIEAMGGQLGICVENLEAFASTVSNISASSNIDADTAAEDLGKLSNIMNLSEDQYQNFGDALIRLGNNTATTEADIMSVTMRFAAMGTQVGMSADEILAWADAAGASGMGAESAGTAMQKTISDIEKAVAGGGDKLKGFAKVSGMSAKEFKEAWSNDASGAIEKFLWGLNGLEKDGKSATKTLSDLGINGSRQKNLLQALANQMGQTSAAGGELSESNNKLHDAFVMSEDAYNGVADAWGAAGDAAREAAQRNEGFSGSIKILRNNVQNAGSIIGDSLAPALNSVTVFVQKAVSAFDGLSQSQKETVLALVGATAAIGPFGNMIGALGQTVTGASAAFAKGEGNLVKLASALKIGSFSGAVAAAGVIAALAAGLVAFGVAAKKQIDYTKKLNESHDRLSNVLHESDAAFSSIPGSVKRAEKSYGELRSETEKLIEEHEQAAQRISDSLEEAYSNVSTLESYKTSIDELMDKERLGTVETEKLAAQIDAVNDACGSNLYVYKATGQVYDLSQASDVTTEALDELVDGIQKTSSESESSKLESYQGVIDTLAGKSNLTAEEMDSLQEAIGYVNEAAGTRYVIDEETGTIKELGETSKMAAEDIDKLIESQQNLAKANAFQEGYQEMIKEQDQASRELKGTQEDLLELLKEENAAYNEQKDLDIGSGEKISYKRQTTEMQGYVEQMREGIGTAVDNAKAQDEMAAKMALTSDAAGTLSEVMGVSGKDMNRMFNEAGVSVDEFSEALVASGVSMTELGSLTTDQWAAILRSCDGNVNQAIETFNKLKTGTVGISDDVMQGILQGFHSHDGELSMEGGSMAAELYEALTGQDYGSAGKVAIEAFLLELTGGDVESVAMLIGEDVDAGLVAGIEGKADLPAEAVGIMSDTTLEAAADALGVHSPSTKFKEFGEFCDEGLAEGIESGADSVIEAAVDMCTSMIDGAKGVLENTTLGKKFMELFGDQVTTASPTVGTAVGSVAQTASDTLNDKVSSITAGLQVGERYASDIKAGSNTVGAAAAALPEAANKAMSAKSTVARNAGSQAAAAFSSGMQGKTGDATRAAENISTQSAAKLASKVNAARTHGASMGTSFSSGVLSKSSLASSAGSTVGNSAKEAMRVDTTPVGYDFDQGLVNGINSGSGMVVSAAAALGRRTRAALEAELEVNSPSKVTERIGAFFDQGLAIGIDEGARDAVTAAGRLAADTINSLNKGITSASYEALQMNIDAAVRTGGVFDSMKANMVTKADIQSAVEAAIAGKNLGSQSITQSVGNVTFNGDEQIRAVITDFVETILMKRGM